MRPSTYWYSIMQRRRALKARVAELEARNDDLESSIVTVQGQLIETIQDRDKWKKRAESLLPRQNITEG